jgi:hypothetical protein
MRTLARSSSFVAAGVLVACTAAHAQVTPVFPAPADPTPAAAQATPPPPPPAPKPVDRASREDIRSMEVLLTQALQTGAQTLARQLKGTAPNSAFVTGTGRARGFILSGHGIFFDVDVPEMRQSMVWSAQMLELEQQRQNLRRFLTTTTADDPRRKIADANLKYIERLMGGSEVVITNSPANTQMAPPGQIRATDVSPVSDSAQQVPPVSDPNLAYTDSVKSALIDVMLKFSGPLKIRDDEWLTVAASDSEGPQTPGAVEETSRILISIKGSDLAAFQAGKLTREEVLKKVEVREF